MVVWLMKLKRKEANLAVELLNQWEKEDLLSSELACKLKDSIEVETFDWQKLAKFAFWFAIFCFVISAGSFVLGPIFKKLVAFISHLFKFIDPKLCSAFAAAGIASLFYFWGLKRRSTHPKTIYKNQAVFFLGILATASSIGFFGSMFKSDHVSPIFLVATLIYAGLGLYFPSRLTWVFSLLSLASCLARKLDMSLEEVLIIWE